ncbi:MAG TPA: hypothetical protein VF921_01725 [Vicinamibacterales bacterium]
MRRFLTVLTLPLLLLSAWDCVPMARANLQLWSRLRQRHRDAPDISWDRFYAELLPYVPARGRVGLVQAAAPGSTARARQQYFLQYALAPRLVTLGADEQLVIAYGPPAARTSLVDVSKFTLVHALGDELALYRRTSP